MSVQFRLPRPVSVPALKRAGPIAATLVAALLLVPSASSGTYTDPSGDSGAAGDITGIAVTGDKASGQVVFKITGSNLASSGLNPLFLTIDSDANPLTGDLTDHGTDYWFGMDFEQGYGFQHWTGSDWVDTSSLSVQIRGSTSELTISVNRSELGNSSTFNFYASTFFVLGSTRDIAPNEGAFNYSFDTNGPRIDSVDVQTTPAAGPKAGKRFVIKPSALKLPPDGRDSTTPILPESYSCTAKLGARALAGQSTGRCTFAIPKQKSRGKRLTVQLTVTYQGTTKTVPLTFKVG